MQILLFCLPVLTVGGETEQQSKDAYTGWQLAVQNWTFHKFSFFETIDKLDSLDVHWMEAYSNQPLGKEYPDVTFGPGMPDSLKNIVKEKLLQAEIKLINFGVVNLTRDRKANAELFEFAGEFGIQTIISEPPMNALKVIDKQCQEYGIRVALHNHPEPSRYWNPETVKKALKGRSSYMGVCGDTGHWMRSGIRPEKAVEMLADRLFCFHLKDLNAFGSKSAHDVPWGMGVLGFKDFLALLHNMGFKGTFSVEYEYNWYNSLDNVQQCVNNFIKIASTLPSGSK